MRRPNPALHEWGGLAQVLEAEQSQTSIAVAFSNAQEQNPKWETKKGLQMRTEERPSRVEGDLHLGG